MKKMIFIVPFVILFLGCSTSLPLNQWQYKSTTAFNAYKESFLKRDLIVAKADLKRAIKHAKMSADLKQLASIYLSKCALEISVSSEKHECQEYRAIESLVKSEKLKSYYLFLQKKDTNVELLPKEYREVASAVATNSLEYKEKLFAIEKPTSFFITASLLQERLDEKDIDRVIKKASLYGYKNIVLFWLKMSILSTQDSSKKQEQMKKIIILSED